MKQVFSFVTAALLLPLPIAAFAQPVATLSCGEYLGKVEPVSRSAYTAKLSSEVTANTFKASRKTERVTEEFTGIKSRDGTIKFVGTGQNLQRADRGWTFELTAPANTSPIVASGQMFSSNGEVLRNCTLTLDASVVPSVAKVTTSEPANRAVVTKDLAAPPQSVVVPGPKVIEPATANAPSAVSQVGVTVGQFLQGIATGARGAGSGTGTGISIPGLPGASGDNARGASASGGKREIGAADIMRSNTPMPPSDTTLGGLAFASKAEFLEATAKGQMLGYDKAHIDYSDPEAVKVLNTIATILEREYRTPVPDWNQRNKNVSSRAAIQCEVSAVKGAMNSALRSVTRAKLGTLTDRPPSFMREAAVNHDGLDSHLRQMRDYCTSTALGTKAPLPFVESFVQLLTEYADATQKAVDAKRANLVAAYEQDKAAQTAKVQREKAAEEEKKQVRVDEQKRKVDTKHKADLARKIQAEGAVARNAARIDALKLPPALLNSTLMASSMEFWVEMVPFRQWVAMVLEAKKPVEKITSDSARGLPGISLKYAGQPALSFYFRVEGNEAYIALGKAEGKYEPITTGPAQYQATYALAMLADAQYLYTEEGRPLSAAEKK